MEERVEKQKAITMVTILHVTARTVCEERSWMETWFRISQWPSVYAMWENLQAIVIKPSGFSCIMTSRPAAHVISSQMGRKKKITNLPPFPHSTMFPRDRKAEGVEANICVTDIHSNFKTENVCMQSTQSLTLTRWAKCAASFYDHLYKQLRLRETKALALEPAALTFI